MEQVSCDRCPLNRFCEALREARKDERRVSYDRHPMWYECPLVSIVLDHRLADGIIRTGPKFSPEGKEDG